MHKYRRLLGELLVASFFLQLLVLVTPSFLPGRHRQGVGASRLHDDHGLVFGLIAVSIFETVLGRQTIARKDAPESCLRSHSRLGPEGHMGHLITNALARPSTRPRKRSHPQSV